MHIDPKKLTSSRFTQAIAGRLYDFDFRKFTGVEERDFRLAVGVAIQRAGEALDQGVIGPLEMIAGLKWLVDRRENPDLKFDDVLGDLTYDDLMEKETDVPVPPPAGNSSEKASQASPTSSA